MTLAQPRRLDAPVFPPGIDPERYLARLRVPREVARQPEWRRWVTKANPIAFALVYLSELCRQQDTGLISFNDLHLDVAQAARHWAAPLPHRSAWVAPRGAGKSAMFFQILPLWALAHGYRKVFMAFAWTEEQAAVQLGNLRAELDDNALLRADFPDLVPTKGRRSKSFIETEGGQAFLAKGIKNSTRGTRVGTARPDLLIGDDLEPSEVKYTAGTRREVLTALRQDIFHMGAPHAAIALCGTTTAYGSVMHDVVRKALGEDVDPWLDEESIRCHYYPAIMRNPDGSERSLWPQRWKLTDLQQMRHTRAFALEMLNNPPAPGEGTWWQPEDFVVKKLPTTGRIMYCDVAMTNNRSSDQTALAIVGRAPGRMASIEHVEAGRITGTQLLERIHRFAEHLDAVFVESNQGGERWREILSPMPLVRGRPLALHLDHVRGSKRSRLEQALAHFQRRAVVCARRFPELERQACAWSPAADEDDLLDAVAGALRQVFPG
jgi:phage terminase large subunit-like protein